MSGYNSGGVGGVGPQKFDAGVQDIKSDIAEVKTDTAAIKEDTEGMQQDMAQLVENVQKQVDDLRTIVENSPAGIPAPPLLSMSAESTENGINVTYKAALLFGRSSNAFVVEDQDNLDQIFSMTKGVMIRYSNESYPLTPKDGILAIIDEDIFTLNADTGIKTAKQKTYEIVGLTNSETYYISAFPYNPNYAYQEAAGLNHKNRVKCQWTGTKGTLTVNVTQDYDYKALGQYKVTMTPTAGGNAITKTQSGAATIVFSGLEAGEYTLSFSAPQYFTAPESQSVTVTAGQSKVTNAQYDITKKINDYNWAEIHTVCQGGDAANLFSVGDVKTIPVKEVSLSSNSNSSASLSTDEYNLDLVIMDFNKDTISGNKKAAIQFCSKQFPIEYYNGYSDVKNLIDHINTESYLLDQFPTNLKNNIVTVLKNYGTRGTGYNIISKTISSKLYPLAAAEVGLEYERDLDGLSKYAYFSSADRIQGRKLSDSLSATRSWVTASFGLINHYSSTSGGGYRTGPLAYINSNGESVGYSTYPYDYLKYWVRIAFSFN